MRIRCRECRVAFPWNSGKFPRYCPECGYDFGKPRADDDICMPSIGSIRAAAADKVYRDMERGSEIRAAAAAEMAGVPVSEMAGLKITNLRSAKNPGEVAAPPVDNVISRMVAAAPQQFGHNPVGMQHAQRVAAGPYPVDRSKMQEYIKTGHAERAAAFKPRV